MDVTTQYMMESLAQVSVTTKSPNKSFQQDKKQLVFVRASLILTSYFIAYE